MASRIARTALGASRARPSIPLRSLRSLTTPITQARYESNVPQKDPKDAAKSILDSLPGNSMISKSAILSAGAALSVAAISNELYVVNEESIVLFCLLTVWTGAAIYGGPAYKEWAESKSNSIKNILNSARTEHTKAVQNRISTVKDLGGVIDITKNLFEVSKETAKLEAQAYELEQKVNVAHDMKSTLDSWVRWEGQVKQKQQRELADSIMANIEKELSNENTLKKILDQSVRDVERILAAKA